MFDLGCDEALEEESAVFALPGCGDECHHAVLSYCHLGAPVGWKVLGLRRRRKVLIFRGCVM